MSSLIIGFVCTALVFFFSMGSENIPLYFNFHSSLLVGGGTIAILFFATPWNVLKNLGRELKGLFQKMPEFSKVRPDLMTLAKNRNAAVQTQDELVTYAQDLWQQGVEHELFIVLLSQKRKEIEQKAVDTIQSLKNLAKYPPALGMAGTVMGIVSLFQTLQGDKNQVGPALAMALTATFFGLLIANAVVMSLSDRLQVRHLSMNSYLDNVYQILLLVNQGEASQLIEDEVTTRAA